MPRDDLQVVEALRPGRGTTPAMADMADDFAAAAKNNPSRGLQFSLKSGLIPLGNVVSPHHRGDPAACFISSATGKNLFSERPFGVANPKRIEHELAHVQ